MMCCVIARRPDPPNGYGSRRGLCPQYPYPSGSCRSSRIVADPAQKIDKTNPCYIIGNPLEQRMESQLYGFNATIIAKSFNPSILRESWLIEQGFLSQGDLRDAYIFSDEAVQFGTSRYSLVLIPQHLQFRPADREHSKDTIDQILSPMVRLLPHTPFRAVGINFIWHLDPGSEPLSSATRRLFCKNDSEFWRHFSADDAQFGAYMSKGLDCCRLKLETRPVVVHRGDQQAEVIQCAFNYHRDVDADNGSDDVVVLLKRWAELDRTSEEITQTIAGEARDGS